MKENPIRIRSEGLGLGVSQLAYQAGFSSPMVSTIFNATKPLPINVADRFAGLVGSDTLTLLIANALWRKEKGIILNSAEAAFITVAETASGLTASQLCELSGNGLGHLERVMAKKPGPAPAVILATASQKAKAPQKDLTTQGPESVPTPPKVILQKEGGK